MTRAGLTLGGFVVQARVEAGLSTRRLAETSGVHKTTIGRIENDQVKNPKPEQLIALSKALELPVGELFRLAGVPLPPSAVTVEALLRADYDLPDEALREVRRDIEAIVARYRSQLLSKSREEGPHGNNY